MFFKKQSDLNYFKKCLNASNFRLKAYYFITIISDTIRNLSIEAIEGAILLEIENWPAIIKLQKFRLVKYMF